MEFRSFCTRVLSFSSFMVFIILVSSANDDTLQWCVPLSISDIWTRNRMGPSTEPCGTPLVTSDSLEKHPSTGTVCLRFERKLFMHLSSFPVMPAFCNFCRTILLCVKCLCKVGIYYIYIFIVLHSFKDTILGFTIYHIGNSVDFCSIHRYFQEIPSVYFQLFFQRF